MASSHQSIWALPIESTHQSLDSTVSSLSEDETTRRLQQFGAKQLPDRCEYRSA